MLLVLVLLLVAGVGKGGLGDCGGDCTGVLGM